MSRTYIDLGDTVYDFALGRVKELIQNPTEELLADPATKLAALHVYTNIPKYKSSWNDMFCIAVGCELPYWVQQQTAWCAVNNGLTSYWCWVTDADLNARLVLSRIGIIEVPSESEVGTDFCDMPETVARQLITKFSLPTCALGMKETLTEDEKHLRNVLQSSCPKRHVL